MEQLRATERETCESSSRCATKHVEELLCEIETRAGLAASAKPQEDEPHFLILGTHSPVATKHCPRIAEVPAGIVGTNSAAEAPC